jgi:DNA-binding transcriptional ArsR family regulator
MEETDPVDAFSSDMEELGGVEGLRRMRPGRQVLKRLERMYSVLSSDNRIEILFFLNFTPLTPGELSEITGMAPNLLSFHLKKLESAGVITSEREGRRRIYSITEIGRSISGPLTK